MCGLYTSFDSNGANGSLKVRRDSPSLESRMRSRTGLASPVENHGLSCSVCWTSGPTPLQAPESTHQEDDGEERGHADRDKRSYGVLAIDSRARLTGGRNILTLPIESVIIMASRYGAR